jgi:hypothetical protein
MACHRGSDRILDEGGGGNLQEKASSQVSVHVQRESMITWPTPASMHD